MHQPRMLLDIEKGYGLSLKNPLQKPQKTHRLRLITGLPIHPPPDIRRHIRDPGDLVNPQILLDVALRLRHAEHRLHAGFAIPEQLHRRSSRGRII